MKTILLNAIKPSSQQIRKSFDEEKMNQLVQSIKEQGLIVPIKVRPDGNQYEIVYGHRRVEAAKRAGRDDIEAIVDGVDDTNQMIQALIENVVREDMEPIDTAKALIALIEKTGWNGLEIERNGIMADSQVTDLLFLLKEPEKIQNLVSRGSTRMGAPEGKITNLHVARVRGVGLEKENKVSVLEKAAREGLSANQTRKIAEAVSNAPSEQAKKKLLEWEYNPTIHDPDLIKSRAKEYGAHDPLYREKSPGADASWKNAPEVVSVIDSIKRIEKEYLKDWTASTEKMSPEARQFIAGLLEKLIKSINEWIAILKGNGNG